MITSNDIILYSKLKCINESSFNVVNVRPPDNLCQQCITLLTKPEEFISLFIKAPDKVIAIIPEELETEAHKFKQTFILSNNPRLTFLKVINYYFSNEEIVYSISETAYINSTGKISSSVKIGNYSIITGNVDIGNSTILENHICINGSVQIGENVSIGSGTIIGHKGFNFTWDEEGIPHEFPHFGKVLIGDNVRIGANCTIARGSLNDTIICDNVKIDDQVHIAHNVKIESGSLIATCAEISGSVFIGKNVWISPNASIIDHVKIGDHAKIGIGAVVLKDVPANSTVIGNPARKIPIKEN